MSCPIVSLDRFRLDDPAIQQDPYPYYPDLREQGPVFVSTFGDRPCWVLSRRADVVAALADPETFSSQTSPVRDVLSTNDPEHQRLRRMVSGLFTRKAVAGMAPHISAEIDRILTPLLEQGTFDVIDDVAGPLTVSVIARLLGVQLDDIHQLRELSARRADFVVALRLGREPSAETVQANEELNQFVLALTRSSDLRPDGVVAKLARLTRESELTEQECVDFVVLLLIAGHTTTTNLTGNIVARLIEHPDEMSGLRQDPATAGAYVEEVLRTTPSFHRLPRITTREVVVGETVIPAGASVYLLLASANRDPEGTEAPEVFDIIRSPQNHVTFGHGLHTCLGQWLARLESTTLLATLIDRVETIRFAAGRGVVRVGGGTFNDFGFAHLPVEITRRPGAEKGNVR